MKYIAEVVKNSSGQIFLQSPLGGTFDMSQYVGERLYVLEPSEVSSLVYRQSAKALQAKIDALMLEFCPEDMTKEQLERWAKSQKPVLE